MIVAIGAAFYLNSSSKTGSITFSPSTISCANPVTFTTTTKLPASVKADDTLTIKFDGVVMGRDQLSTSSDAHQQTDGSWLVVSATTASEMQSVCASGGGVGGVNIIAAGRHTEQVLDATGSVLAEGSYTATP